MAATAAASAAFELRTAGGNQPMRLFQPLLAAAVLTAPLSAHALLIRVTTDATVVGVPGQAYSFGDYVFQLVDPQREPLNLFNGEDAEPDTLDYLVSNVRLGRDFSLTRVDDGLFSLIGVLHAGLGVSTIGGVAVPHAGTGLDISNFQTLVFDGQPGLTNTASVVFSPGNTIQIAAVDVISHSVPEPGTLALLGVGLIPLLWRGKRATA